MIPSSTIRVSLTNKANRLASDVFHIDMLDDKHAAAFDQSKPWIYQDDEVQLAFATEYEACAEQRKRNP